MSNYVPWYGKKRSHLTERESDLLRSLDRGENAGKVNQAAEEVRLAKIRMLKAERSQVVVSNQSHAIVTARLDKLDREIHDANSMPVGAIVSKYRRKLSQADRTKNKPTNSQ
ncbi:hypothetical protein [Singulisphaera acidiphila]|uniref:Uncharacterized protein n=1 Tax=Singulisphaera acidiphila (strain ATCC BAA-1392 / DSM 18658 / VKM B-2454 / MOB10) TaxID=886293 RepID=L0DIR9_SINAD|nr:hypothetical protein [Singulisphaera acidiphila]AGA28713.1 hypothetical protein Sinac_4531 [Singulisphaera acidiphila DSM 18658]